MTTSAYVFDGTRDEPELARLRAVEGAFDEGTRRALGATGLHDDPRRGQAARLTFDRRRARELAGLAAAAARGACDALPQDHGRRQPGGGAPARPTTWRSTPARLA